MRSADIVVAGAGALGRVIALALARAGCAVTVVDPMQANASRIAAGMLAPAFEALFDAPASGDFALLRQARDLWPALAAEIDLPLARDGALAIGSRAEAEDWAAQLAAAGAVASVLSPSEVGRLVPQALEQMAPERAAPERAAPELWATFTPEDWRLAPDAAMHRLRAAAERCGARFLEGRVAGFEGGRVELAGSGRLTADRLVIASGADPGLAALAPEVDALTPIKGHILRAEGPFRPAPVVRSAGAYLCRGEGEAVVGSTMEVGVAGAGVDPAVAARLSEAAAGLIELAAGPTDREIAWRAEAAVRASTPDGLPLVGPANAAGVILAVGARRNGWLLAPLIARVVLDVIESKAPAGPAARFDPARLVTPG